MARLLVRNIDESLVRELKRRATVHGVSAEEEHRRILKEALSKPPKAKPSLIEFLLSPDSEVAPEIELDLERSREVATRDSGFMVEGAFISFRDGAAES